MTQKAGERLFEAIGGIPEEMILEADQDSLQEHTDERSETAGMHTGDGEDRRPNGKGTGRQIEKKAGSAEQETDKIGTSGQQTEQGAGKAGPQTEQGAGKAGPQTEAEWTDQQTQQKAERAGQQTEQEAGWDTRQRESRTVKSRRQKDDEREKSRQQKDGKTKTARRGTAYENIGSLLKYLSAAACLCLVFGGIYYVISSFTGAGQAVDSSMSGMESAYDTASGTKSPDELPGAESALDAGASESGASWEAGAVAGGETGSDDQKSDTDGSGQQTERTKPLRYDAYEGPLMTMTATGDTQKLKTSRTLKGTAVTERHEESSDPLLYIEDSYRIRNRSGEDKTLQLVYPFVSTLNPAYDPGSCLMEISTQDDPEVSYNVGESIRSYWDQDLGWTASAGDYWNLFQDGEEYQERALKKEADWNREVLVYIFSWADTQEDTEWNDAGVIGVTVNGEDADVLTYGFDYASRRTQNTADYCFFAGDKDRPRYLIITGEIEESPQMGYYANLDCADALDGEDVPYQMQTERMSYADALRMCSRAAARQLSQDYEQGVYEGELPEYLDGDTLYQALTVIGEEETFYDKIMRQYESTELGDIYEKLFGESRVIYALTTVTIPAGKAIRVTMHTQRRQVSEYYTVLAGTGHDGNQTDQGQSGRGDERQEQAEERDGYRGQTGETYEEQEQTAEEDEEQEQAKEDKEQEQLQADQEAGVKNRYDILPGTRSQLNIQKTVCVLELPDEWQITDQNMNLKQKGSVWRAVLHEKLYHFAIKYVLNSVH